MSDPWFKFFPADWRGEATLRAVSIAARGLWMEMLCLMHEAEPRGHLLLNGRPVTDTQLAAIAGVPLDIAQACLGELESAGTFSRTRAGVIYSRRMRADTALSKKQRANVEKRWSKQPISSTAQGVDGKRKNGSGITKSIPTPIPKKPYARSQKEDTSVSSQPRAPAPVGASDDWPPDPKEWAQTICREADSPNLNIHQSQDLLLGMRHLVGMRAAGCSWTLDVIPVVTDLAGRSKRRIGSWEYFREAILEARNRRIEAGKAMPAPPRPMDDQAREQVIERALRMRTLSPSTPWPATIGMDEEAAKRWLETVRAA